MAKRMDVNDRVVKQLLDRRVIGKVNPEDPKRCEAHRFILSRLDRFQCPNSAREWQKTAVSLRKQLLKDVYLKGHSEDVISAKPDVVWGEVIETGKGYRIRKLRYEGFPGMWIPALMYEPVTLQGKVPGVLNPNGHHPGGKAMDYKQARCINLAKRGMLALNTEFIGMGELTANRDHFRIGHMDLCGKAGVAVFYLAMKRGLDVLIDHPHCDANRVAMTGLSGGGWQTAVLSALDERVTVIVPVAGHSPVWQRASCLADIGDLEQVPSDLCTVADFDAMTALFAPRPSLLIYNLNDDCCFRSRRTRLSVYNPVKPVYELMHVADDFEFYENRDPGTHNYERDSREQLYRFLNRHFGLDTPEEELPFEDELMSESQLNVGLPEDNATLISLAQDASRGLPNIVKGKARMDSTRKRLGEVIHLPTFQVKAEKVAERSGVALHRLSMDKTWTVPVTEVLGDGDVHLVLGDGGRSGLRNLVMQYAQEGDRVVAADVFGTGEGRVHYQLQMLMAGTGARPLGVMVGQIVAVMRWAGGRKKVRVSAVGPVTGFAALCAAALEPNRVSHLYLDGMYDSLKRLIDWPMSYDSVTPLFCFGLLKVADVPQLMAMTEGLSITWRNRGPVQPI